MVRTEELSQRRQEKLRRSWRDQHHTKRVHASRLAAWRAIARLFRDNIRNRTVRRRDIRLCPYRCRWGADWRDGRSYPAHWHIGHHRYGPLGRTAHAWRRRLRWLSRRYRRWLLYPRRRAVSRVRIAVRTRSLARHPGWHKSEKADRRRAAARRRVAHDTLTRQWRTARPVGR